MKATIHLAGQNWQVDLAKPVDLSIPLAFNDDQPNAFDLSPATARAVEAGGFVGDTRRGGSANCADVCLNPHGNGTHTECVGHIVDERVAIGGVAVDALVPCTVLSVQPEVLSGSAEHYAGRHLPSDQVLTAHALEQAAQAIAASSAFSRALVVRTLPNDGEKRVRSYSGTNPPYPTEEAMRWIRDRGVTHLVVDLPSVDREDDGGVLPNHHVFWAVGPQNQPAGAAAGQTITEMAFVPDDVADGIYVLNLQIPNFVLDAAPSRPVLFGVRAAR